MAEHGALHTRQKFKSALPIFRQSDVTVYSPVEAKTADELATLTFHEWLDYFFRRLPPLTEDNKKHPGKSLFSDQQYIDLLHQYMSSQSVAEQMEGRTQQGTNWLYYQLKTGTFKCVEMFYRVAADRVDSGPVLVTFVEATTSKAKAYRKRHPSSQDKLTHGMMRRCVPFSQVEGAVMLCHRGPTGHGHLGMDNTSINCVRMFDGITRELCRMCVRRCGVCQTKQPKKYKAPLVPLVSRALWERVVMDLIDMGEDSRSMGYRYIWHCQCHFSEYNFSGLLVHKTAAEVSILLDNMLALTGPIKILQCDNGGEFKARVLEVCKKWKMDPPTNSSPYTPTTNGLVERAGGTLQVGVGEWMEQFNTREWAECVASLTYQSKLHRVQGNQTHAPRAGVRSATPLGQCAHRVRAGCNHAAGRPGGGGAAGGGRQPAAVAATSECRSGPPEHEHEPGRRRTSASRRRRCLCRCCCCSC